MCHSTYHLPKQKSATLYRHKFQGKQFKDNRVSHKRPTVFKIQLVRIPRFFLNQSLKLFLIKIDFSLKTPCIFYFCVVRVGVFFS